MAVLVKTLNGLAYASCKTKQGLAMASIKTINGLDVTSAGGDPNWANVVLLLHCDGTDASTSFPDNSDSNLTVTASGDGQVDTAVVKYGTGSLMATLAGTGYLSAAATGANEFTFGTGDFTVEFWIWMSTPASGDGSGLVTGNRKFYMVYVGGSFYCGDGSVNPASAAFGVGYRDKWTFVAVSRTSGTTKIFYDGTQVASAADTTDYGQSATTMLVNRNGDGSPVYGGAVWYDDIRVTKGVGRYTSGFTPPTAAFPDF